jgi:hypothetical protein
MHVTKRAAFAQWKRHGSAMAGILQGCAPQPERVHDQLPRDSISVPEPHARQATLVATYGSPVRKPRSTTSVV